MRNIPEKNEETRFILNGLIATSIHFLILYLCVNFFRLDYYGVSNLMGAIFGTAYSFLGNKYYVFRNSNNNILIQTSQFITLYSFMAINHGAFLYFWSDLCNYNYLIGFILITTINTVLSFFVNKYKIFK